MRKTVFENEAINLKRHNEKRRVFGGLINKILGLIEKWKL